MKVCKTLLVTVAGSLVLLGGCKSDCEKLVAKSVECEKEKKITSEQEEAFVKLCEANKDELKDELECMNKHDDCDAIKKCNKEASAAKFVQKRLDKVKELKGEGKLAEAATVCGDLMSDEESKDNDEVASKCKPVVDQAGKAKIAEIKAQVDKGKFGQAIHECKMALKYDDAMKDNADLKKYCASLGELAAKAKIKEIKAEVEKGEYSGAMLTCKYALENKDFKGNKDLKTYCGSIAKGAVEGLSKKITAIRDKQGESDIAACLKLKDMAKKVGGDAPKQAEVLCKEANVAADVKKVLAEVKKNTVAKKNDIPYQCAGTVEALKKVGSPWADKQAEAVIKACYLEFGAAVMERSKNERFCKIGQREVIKAVKKFGIKDANLDKLIAEAKTKQKCKD